MTWRLRCALLVGVAVLAFGSVGAAAPPAGAYRTSSNWYSKTWWFNKSETYRIAWVNPNPTVAIQGIIGMPGAIKVALSAYGYSFKWMAQQARSRNGCFSIYWIYVNLPIPQMYWGMNCY